MRALALEFTWHRRRDQLMKDCRKDNDLSNPGLTVLRFGWEHVGLGQAG